MIILPSRNGMLLRNSNGILASDCGGPVEFNCPCTLLTGDNSDCYDTDCTPSTYIVTTTEESYCLVYVSGSTWQKTVGTRVITLNLEAASETTSITIVDDGVTVFSGTNTGTSCIHRWTGSMSNTITPDTIGSVSYSTECEQPDFECPCSLLSGDNCGAFNTNETPSTYIADFGDSGVYCLAYIEDCEWSATIGSLSITLNLSSDSSEASLVVIDDGVTVFSGIYNGTSGLHRWSGSVSNTIAGSDWGDASYYTDCEIPTPEEECSCAFVAGDACSCFGYGETPTKYYVIVGGIKWCLSYVSGCTWVKDYGDLTITLNLTNSATASSITIVDGGVTVFTGTYENGGTDCRNRWSGVVENTLTENDWGSSAFYYPACSTSSCADSRLFLFEFIDLNNVVMSYVSSSEQFIDDYGVLASTYGYFDEYPYGALCEYRIYADGEYSQKFQAWSCNEQPSPAYSTIFRAVLGPYPAITLRIGNDDRDMFNATGSLPFSSMSPGDSITFNNTETAYTANSTSWLCEEGCDYYYGVNSSSLETIRGQIKITVL